MNTVNQSIINEIYRQLKRAIPVLILSLFSNGSAQANLPAVAYSFDAANQLPNSGDLAKQRSLDEAPVRQTAQDFLEQGYVYSQQGDFQSAIERYTEALRLDPQYTEALYLRGIAYSSQENYPLAFEDFTQALHLQPDFAEAYYHRAWTHGLPNQAVAENLMESVFSTALDGMISDLHIALQLQPELPHGISHLADAYYQRALLFANEENLERALAYYQRALYLYQQTDSLSQQQLIQGSIEELMQRDPSLSDYSFAQFLSSTLDINDVRIDFALSFRDAIFGDEIEVRFDRLRRNSSGLLALVSTTFTIDVPPGITHETRLRIQEEGDEGIEGLLGTLYIYLDIPNEYEGFRREGIDILSVLQVSEAQAEQGAQLQAATIDGEVMVTLPPGTTRGTELSIPGHGVPELTSPDIRGDHIFIVDF
ncbi:MAG: DnaJ C-terminal domain-containing protein [Cyanobacteria bacterium J06633_2]